MDRTQGTLRIGELARRTGVSPALLRAWEQRYGLLAPDRTPGGLRLFSARDEQRVRAMAARIACGLSAAQAARRSSPGRPRVQAAPPAPGARPAWTGGDAPASELDAEAARLGARAAGAGPRSCPADA